MNERFLENIKVSFRKSPILYKLSKLLYSPIIGGRKFKHYCRIVSKSKMVVNELSKLEVSNNRVFYLGVPVHENLGDAAQMYCIRKWIRRYYPKCDIIEIESEPTNMRIVRSQLERLITPSNTLIVESGATFSDKHVDHNMHRYLLSTFKKNKLLFMPNTVNIDDIGQMKITAGLFNAHPKAMFLARDPESLNMIKPYFDNSRIKLYPDIVTTLIGNIRFDGDRDGVLVCKRIDGEKLYSDSDSKEMMNQLKSIAQVDLTDTNFEDSIEYTYSNLEEIIMRKLQLFSRYKVVLTDRYHGMIFSLIAQTPVVVLATKGHKVREGALWFKRDYPNSIWFCETPDDAFAQVKELLMKDVKLSNKNLYSEKYFDKLYDVFNTTVG